MKILICDADRAKVSFFNLNRQSCKVLGAIKIHHFANDQEALDAPYAAMLKYGSALCTLIGLCRNLSIV